MQSTSGEMLDWMKKLESRLLGGNAGLDEEAGIKIAGRNIKKQYHH